MWYMARSFGRRLLVRAVHCSSGVKRRMIGASGVFESLIVQHGVWY